MHKSCPLSKVDICLIYVNYFSILMLLKRFMSIMIIILVIIIMMQQCSVPQKYVLLFKETVHFIQSTVALTSGKTSDHISENEEEGRRTWLNVMWLKLIHYLVCEDVRLIFISKSGRLTMKTIIPMIPCYFTMSPNYVFQVFLRHLLWQKLCNVHLRKI